MRQYLLCALLTLSTTIALRIQAGPWCAQSGQTPCIDHQSALQQKCAQAWINAHATCHPETRTVENPDATLQEFYTQYDAKQSAIAAQQSHFPAAESPRSLCLKQNQVDKQTAQFNSWMGLQCSNRIENCFNHCQNAQEEISTAQNSGGVVFPQLAQKTSERLQQCHPTGPYQHRVDAFTSSSNILMNHAQAGANCALDSTAQPHHQAATSPPSQGAGATPPTPTKPSAVEPESWVSRHSGTLIGAGLLAGGLGVAYLVSSDSDSADEETSTDGAIDDTTADAPEATTSSVSSHTTDPALMARIDQHFANREYAAIENILATNNSLSADDRAQVQQRLTQSGVGTPGAPGAPATSTGAAATTAETGTYASSRKPSSIDPTHPFDLQQVRQNIQLFTRQRLWSDVRRQIQELIGQGFLREALEEVVALENSSDYAAANLAKDLRQEIDAQLASMGLPAGSMGVDMIGDSTPN